MTKNAVYVHVLLLRGQHKNTVVVMEYVRRLVLKPRVLAQNASVTRGGREVNVNHQLVIDNIIF